MNLKSSISRSERKKWGKERDDINEPEGPTKQPNSDRNGPTREAPQNYKERMKGRRIKSRKYDAMQSGVKKTKRKRCGDNQKMVQMW